MTKSTITLLTLFFAFASFSAQAQMADRLHEQPTFSKSADAQAVVLTREMTQRLHLNEGEFLELLPLNRIKLAGLNDINRLYKHDQAERTAKAAELEAQYEQECSRILTPSQLSQLHRSNEQPAAAPANSGNGLG